MPLADAPVLDAFSPLETGADVVVVVDAPADGAALDVPAAVEVAPDGSADGASAEAGPTTVDVLRNCTAYTHSLTYSGWVIGDWGLVQLAFSPDGKHLVSFGEDGRAKLWNMGKLLYCTP